MCIFIFFWSSSCLPKRRVLLLCCLCWPASSCYELYKHCKSGRSSLFVSLRVRNWNTVKSAGLETRFFCCCQGTDSIIRFLLNKTLHFLRYLRMTFTGNTSSSWSRKKKSDDLCHTVSSLFGDTLPPRLRMEMPTRTGRFPGKKTR